MSGDRIINTGGGAYNEAVYGNSINVQDNSVHIYDNSSHIDISQDLSRAANQIYQQVVYWQNQGDSLEVAQHKVASDLKRQAVQKPELLQHLQKLGQYIGTESANGVIGQLAVNALKLVLGTVGLPIL
jgi:hypothetical protein